MIINYKNKLSFDILNNISDHVTLVQLEDSSGNVNHAIIIKWCLIYNWNYKRALTLMREYVDIICYPSKYEIVMYAELKDISYSVRYKKPLAKSEKGIWWRNNFLFYERIYIYIYYCTLIILCLPEWKNYDIIS